MSGEGIALLTIVGMAMVTYGTRITGLLVMSRVTVSDRTRAWLEGIPGAVLVSLVAPEVLTKGVPELAGGVITALVAIRTQNMLASAAAGVASVWLLRHML